MQGLYQFNGRAGGGRQGMREVGASARLRLRGLWEGSRWGVGLATTGGAEVEGESQVKKAGGL